MDDSQFFAICLLKYFWVKINTYIFISFEAFVTTEFNEMFSGRQPLQDVEVLWRFGNWLRLHLQGSADRLVEQAIGLVEQVNILLYQANILFYQADVLFYQADVLLYQADVLFYQVHGLFYQTISNTLKVEMESTPKRLRTSISWRDCPP